MYLLFGEMVIEMCRLKIWLDDPCQMQKILPIFQCSTKLNMPLQIKRRKKHESTLRNHQRIEWRAEKNDFDVIH